MKKTELPDLANLQNDLYIANVEHENAQSELSRAQSAECSALNKLNNTQKALDAAMDKIREGASYVTNWGQQRKRDVVHPRG